MWCSMRSLHREWVVRRGPGRRRRHHRVCGAVDVSGITERSDVAERSGVDVAGGGGGVADATQRANWYDDAAVAAIAVIGVRF